MFVRLEKVIFAAGDFCVIYSKKVESSETAVVPLEVRDLRKILGREEI